MSATQPVPDATTDATLDPGPVAAHISHRDAERFVVGVDGSGQSIDALRWAARIAAGTDAGIEVLTTWEPRLGMSGPSIPRPGGTHLGPEDDAHALLSRAVDTAYGRDRPPNLTLSVRQGDAGQILIEASRTAHLLVIGSRGLGEVAGLLLGSVSAHCAEKAQCPVLIMHSSDPS